jgi:hypothetical protein
MGAAGIEMTAGEAVLNEVRFPRVSPDQRQRSPRFPLAQQ